MNENKFEKEIDIENELKHWGILGMHWGIRRYQNPDGSLTPEGRERYLKNPNDKKNESYNEEGKKKFVDPKYFQGNSNKVNFKAVEEKLNGNNHKFDTKINKLQVEFIEKATKNEYGNSLFGMVSQADAKGFTGFITSDDHSKAALEKYLNSVWPSTFNDSDINALYKYITDLDDYINKSNDFLSEQVDTLDISDSKQESMVEALTIEYIVPAIGVTFSHSDIDDDDELKHWGILGMKWGIRNYQNPDGSLTPLGRIRYGVGAAKNKTGNIAGINDASSLSDEELKKMTRRYQQQADYYNARNNYIYQEARFKENTAPPPKKPSAFGRFMGNVFGQPIQDFLAKNVQFGLGALGYGLLNHENPELATQYFNSVAGLRMEYKKKDPLKESTDEIKKNAEYWKAVNELEENKHLYNDIKSGKHWEDKERKRRTDEMNAQNKYDSAKIKYEKNRDYEDEKKMNEVASGFRKVWDENANEYVYSTFNPGWDPEDMDWDDMPNGGMRYPKKNKDPNGYWDDDWGPRENFNGGMRYPKKKKK